MKYFARRSPCSSPARSKITTKDYSTSTWYGLRNVTSFITSITHFIDTAVTNTYTTTTAINATYEKSWDIAAPQIPARNKAGSDQSTSVAELNGTAVVTGGVTV